MECKRITKVQKMAPIYSPLFQLLMHSRIKTKKICHHTQDVTRIFRTCRFKRKLAIPCCAFQNKQRLSLHGWTESVFLN